MSIALERIDLSGFAGSASVFEAEERRVTGGGGGGGGEVECCSSSSVSSSIGRNSDEDDDGVDERASSDGEDCSKEDEAESAYKGPLDMMESLEEVLPIRRGISKFYNGKSKSFTMLSDATTASSVKEIVKPENAYSRRRRNLLAMNHFWEKNRSFGGGISKKPITTSKSSLALAVAMSSSSEFGSCASDDSSSSSNSRSPPRLPPLHPQSRASYGNLSTSSPPRRNYSAWRSYSVADLPQCTMVPSKLTGEKADDA